MIEKRPFTMFQLDEELAGLSFVFLSSQSLHDCPHSNFRMFLPLVTRIYTIKLRRTIENVETLLGRRYHVLLKPGPITSILFSG